ncbi:cupin domain-containing protein [Enterobacter mori]
MAYQLNLNWPEFLEKYWQKQPVVLKNAFPNFVDPITPDELAGLAMEPEVDSRLVSHFNGKWQASNGPFEHFDDLGETGWSLLAQAVNHWHMPAAELVRPFRVLPDWRLDDLMISFSVPGGGVGPHIDQYDVFIIQGMGSRRWRVGDKLPMRQFCPHPALLHVDPFEPIIDEDLAPGDILYIPPGFPHDGFTHETALNYSVGFRGPNGRDLISSFADYAPEEVLDALQGGETLSRLSGLRVLNINGSFFINSEQLETVDAKAADALCRYTELGQAELGDALNNPAFVEELTGLINQGYWYFDE